MALKPIMVETTRCGETEPLLVIHGGAGKRLHPDTPEKQARADAAMRRALDAGMAKLQAGEPAIEAVIAALHVMEDAPEFNAGVGAALTSEGKAELDSCVMLGDGSTGAATGLTTARHPIDVARAIMEQTPHVLFADPTDEQLVSWGIELVDNDFFVTEERRAMLAETKALPDGGWKKPGHGTIGAVARDASGNIAAGTSTGGCTNQQPGRVGDSPICGSGTYANQQTVAVSCTGTGEYYVKEVAAHQVHSRVLWAGQTPYQAAEAVLEAVEDRGGDGGIIVVPAKGPGVVGYHDGAQMDYGYAFGDVRVTHE